MLVSRCRNPPFLQKRHNKLAWVLHHLTFVFSLHFSGCRFITYPFLSLSCRLLGHTDRCHRCPSRAGVHEFLRDEWRRRRKRWGEIVDCLIGWSLRFFHENLIFCIRLVALESLDVVQSIHWRGRKVHVIRRLVTCYHGSPDWASRFGVGTSSVV